MDDINSETEWLFIGDNDSRVSIKGNKDDMVMMFIRNYSIDKQHSVFVYFSNDRWGTMNQYEGIGAFHKTKKVVE